MQEQLFKSIEEDLSELMVVLSEEEYVAFIEKDRIMKLYENVVDMQNRDNILTDDLLKAIAKYVNLKLDMHKNFK